MTRIWIDHDHHLIRISHFGATNVDLVQPNIHRSNSYLRVNYVRLEKARMDCNKARLSAETGSGYPPLPAALTVESRVCMNDRKRKQELQTGEQHYQLDNSIQPQTVPTPKVPTVRLDIHIVINEI